MKIIYAIVVFAALLLVLCFALSNRQGVNVGLWPLTGTIAVPLYLVGLAPLVFGLVFGGVWGWATGVPHRFRARWLKKEMETLNDKIVELQKNTTTQPEFVTRKKPFWERQS